jgi:enoyl-CoA hydratase/carnithine racemase
MPEYTTFDYQLEDGIAVVTFSRPEKMNTFTMVMVAEMLEMLDRTDADDVVRGIVVTGSGRAFCAGADLGAAGDTFAYKPGEDGRPHDIDVNGVRRDGGGRVVLRIYRSLKPIVAAVNGAAVGVGATMQLPMDARLASTSARFGFVFCRRGITPEACSSWFLPRLVGLPTALEWFYSGRVFDAEEALARGLVQSLHEPEKLVDDAIARVRTMTQTSAPVSIALARQLVWQSQGAAHPMDVHRIDSRSIQERGRSADAKEGINAFLEKRESHFTDRVSDGMPEFFPWRDEPEFE